MRRSVEADAPARGAIDGVEHRAGRAFAVCAGNVDEAEPLVRRSGELGEAHRTFKSELRPEHLEREQEFNGIAVKHPAAYAAMRRRRRRCKVALLGYCGRRVWLLSLT